MRQHLAAVLVMEGVILAAVLLSVERILCESLTWGPGVFVWERLREVPPG